MKPILFNTEMARAISEGRKTVTRRVVKFTGGRNPKWTGYIKDGLTLYNGRNEPCNAPAPYKVNDVLYVRETWRWLPCWQCGNDLEGGTCNKENRYNVKYGECGCYQYKADGGVLAGASKPSIHMPKEAARIFLRVTGIRVERLQDMETADDREYIKEGATDKYSFIAIWNSTVKDESQGWYGNPYVWVIDFEPITKEQAYKLDRQQS